MLTSTCNPHSHLGVGSTVRYHFLWCDFLVCCCVKSGEKVSSICRLEWKITPKCFPQPSGFGFVMILLPFANLSSSDYCVHSKHTTLCYGVHVASSMFSATCVSKPALAQIWTIIILAQTHANMNMPRMISHVVVNSSFSPCYTQPK